MKEKSVKLKRPLPPGRTLAQVQNHYRVEKDIADRLRTSSGPQERKRLYAAMYDELFSRVPDHPRLTRRSSEQLTAQSNRNKISLVKRFLDTNCVFAEFAPGDCRFAYAVAPRVRHVFGIDISDQRDTAALCPENFTMIVYDGYCLDDIADSSVDIIFSDQLIEHIHPDDIAGHFALARRLLKPGGRYVFRTPHMLTGPHDISKYFSDEPECFHLKEWSYREIKGVLMKAGFSGFNTYRFIKGVGARLPYPFFATGEYLLGLLPARQRRLAAHYVTPSLIGAAIR